MVSAHAQINDELALPQNKLASDSSEVVSKPEKSINTSKSSSDSSVMRVKQHSPKKATLLSLAIPGAGQLYNKKNWWWKVPIIYGGGAALAYGAVFYQRNYLDYKRAYEFKLKNPDTDTGNPKFDQYQTPTLRNARDSYKDARDQCFIGLGLLYAMQVIDACVEAHFFDFNVNDNLSLNVQPQLGIYGTTAYSGVQFTLTLK